MSAGSKAGKRGSMNMQSNTIFITGGGSGIGKGLAESFHRLGNRVIIAGRNEGALKSVCAANAGMSYAVLDITDAAAIGSVAQRVVADFPDLNCVINNAGIQRVHDFRAEGRAERPRHRRRDPDQPAGSGPPLRRIHPAPAQAPAGNAGQRFFRIGVCAHEHHSHLLRNQGGGALVHRLLAAPVERLQRSGDRTGAAVCGHQSEPWRPGRGVRRAAEAVRCRWTSLSPRL